MAFKRHEGNQRCLSLKEYNVEQFKARETGTLISREINFDSRRDGYLCF